MTSDFDCPWCPWRGGLGSELVAHVLDAHTRNYLQTRSAARVAGHIMQYDRSASWCVCWCGWTGAVADWHEHMAEDGGLVNHVLRLSLGVD